MSDYVCDQLREAINLLKEALKSCDREEIALLVAAVAKILKDLYAPLKDDFYYGNLICKELYVEIRTLRECLIDLLVGQEVEPCSDDCFCEDQCSDRLSQGILSLLQDAGGSVDCCDLEEVASLLHEALGTVLKIKGLQNSA